MMQNHSIHITAITRSVFCIYFFFLPLSSPSTYFASPADSLPDTEIDKHPCNSECDSQWDPDLPGLLQTIGQLVHVTSAGEGVKWSYFNAQMQPWSHTCSTHGCMHKYAYTCLDIHKEPFHAFLFSPLKLFKGNAARGSHACMHACLRAIFFRSENVFFFFFLEAIYCTYMFSVVIFWPRY